MERRGELILFGVLTFLIPAILVSISVFFLTDVLLIVFAFIWMGFCLIVLTPSAEGD